MKPKILNQTILKLLVDGAHASYDMARQTREYHGPRSQEIRYQIRAAGYSLAERQMRGVEDGDWCDTFRGMVELDWAKVA